MDEPIDALPGYPSLSPTLDQTQIPLEDKMATWFQRSHTNQRSSQPVVKGPEYWKKWVEVKVGISNLPDGITTWSIYEPFSRYGHITHIFLNEKASLHRGRMATVVFCPPPKTAFWERRYLRIKQPHSNTELQIGLQLQAPSRSFTLASPINPRLFYPERLILPATSIEFGYLKTENTMVSMHSILPDDNQSSEAEFMVNLLRGEVEINFSMLATVNATDTNSLDRFKIRIPITKISHVYEQSLGDNERALVLPLETPPQVFKRTNDMAATHDSAITHWSDWWAWFRQTQIVTTAASSTSQPVDLLVDDAIIDIGRWTTYRLIFRGTAQVKTDYDTVCRVLRDYNVNVIPQQAISISLVPQKDTGLRELLQFSAALLPFEVQYQLEVCLSQERIHPSNLTQDFIRKLSNTNVSDAVAQLEQAADQKSRLYNPDDIFSLATKRKSFVREIPATCVLQRSVTITPTTVYFSTPNVEVSNRVLRRFNDLQDRFLRVKFSEELGFGRIFAVENNTYDEVFARIRHVMNHGVVVAGQKYEFLAFGNSQFREHGAYFFASNEQWSAASMRDWLGDLSNMPGQKTVSKWCARLGQNFSTTRAINAGTITIRDQLSDIQRNGYTFTDGVGKISKHLASLIATEFGMPNPLDDPPSLFQFRLGGCKGVLALAPELEDGEIHIRESQYKFPARLNGLEVIRFSAFAAASTNRQLIILLSALGVSDQVFLNKLQMQLQQLDRAMTDKHTAVEILRRNVDVNQSTLALADIIADGFMESQEPFVISLLRLWRTWTIKYLKDKAKLSIEQAACVFGCVDEYRVLKGHYNNEQPSPYADRAEKERLLPEIFLQIDNKEPGHYYVVEGVCILARNPSLHPGDIRVVRAVDRPQLHHLKNTVVLPQTGDRDLANMCSGGDLDGDDFIVSWDPELLPAVECWNEHPMDFEAAPAVDAGKPVTVRDIAEFFVSYMKNDRLPTIAHAHLATADASDFGVRDSKCRELAQLHSLAVDYPKSGVPVSVPKCLRPNKWPHFMEKRKPASQIYKSRKILGKLYDLVQLADFTPQYEYPFNSKILQAHKPDEDTLIAAAEIKQQYDAAIKRIMVQHDIQDEFQVWSTFVLSHNFEKKDYDFGLELGRIVGAVKDRFRKVCVEKAGGDDPALLDPFVVAMYKVTADEIAAAVAECKQIEVYGGLEVPLRKMEPKSMPMLSFPWLFDDILRSMVTGAQNPRTHVMRMRTALQTPARPANGSSTSNEILVETPAGGVVHTNEDLILFDEPTAEKSASIENSTEPDLRTDYPDDEHARAVEASITYGRLTNRVARRPTLLDYNPLTDDLKEWAPGRTMAGQEMVVDNHMEDGDEEMLEVVEMPEVLQMQTRNDASKEVAQSMPLEDQIMADADQTSDGVELELVISDDEDSRENRLDKLLAWRADQL